jgi:outer membrane lipoprotein-sorting protein
MNRHRQISRLLPAFALGELDDTQASQVRRHVAQCSRCRQDLEQQERLLSRIACLGEQSVDRQACESAGRKVLSAATQERMERPRRAVESGGARLWRIVMKNGATKLAVAALIVVAAVLALYTFTGTGATDAYAQVVDRLHSAHTLTYSIVNKTGMETMPTVRTQIAFKEPGYLRTSTADGYVTVVHASEAGVRGLNLVPLQKKYMTFEFTNVPDTPDTGPYVSVEKLRALPGQADEALGRRQIDGRTLEGYQVHETDMTTTVWVDPRTGEPARVEMEFAAAPGMDMVLSDFQFDVTLDDSLFSLEPPAGYEPMGVDLQADMDEVGEKDLIAFLRLWSSWTADRTFPPTLTGTEIGKIAMQMGQEGKFTGSSGFDRDQEAKIMYNGMVFMGKLPSGSWRYAGQNVPFGDPQTPIFWYCPEGAATWRVIYADLNVKTVTPERLPK